MAHNALMRVLVVEDDAGIASGLRNHLGQLHWAVDIVGGVEAAWTALTVESFDLVLLDLGLSDGEGAEVLRRLRQTPQGRLPDSATPVLIMTARDQVAARIECLDMGADDYVTKPFDPDELAARMRALRRRAVGRAQSTIRCGPVVINPATRSVHLNGRLVELASREFGVLLALVEVSPRVLSRAQIEARLYSFDNVLDSNAVEVHVHHLRKKLGEGLIRTMRGVGYFMPEHA